MYVFIYIITSTYETLTIPFIHKDMVEEISASGECSASLNDSHETNSNISEDIHDEEVCTRNLCVYISCIYVGYTKMHRTFMSTHIS